MVWSSRKYKEDERDAFPMLFKLAGWPMDSPITSDALVSATKIICRGDIIAPQKLRDSLQRVIDARDRVSSFHRRNGTSDDGHEYWLKTLRQILESLERHVMSTKQQIEKRQLREADLANGRTCLQSDDVPPVVSHSTMLSSQIAKVEPSAMKYVKTIAPTILINYIEDLVSIRDWLKLQWIRAARGIDDLATVAYSSYAARELARSVFNAVDFEIGWKDPSFIRYAREAGLLDNKDEYVSIGANSSIIVVTRHHSKIRWHVYSEVGDYMDAPNFDISSSNHMLAQLERWLFCAAVSGWDYHEDLTSVRDRCLLTV
ncbi:hypothetical protein F5884DRAFT_814945, partial [Xylogone sp. PMI_703]